MTQRSNLKDFTEVPPVGLATSSPTGGLPVSRCEICRLRPYEVTDPRWGPTFAVCTSCYEGATP